LKPPVNLNQGSVTVSGIQDGARKQHEMPYKAADGCITLSG
jgi:hypothetical protein